MLQAFPTKNGTGISIFGDFRELNLLYDTIHHFGSILDENKYPEKAQHLLLMNFAYEVRKSFSGQRFTKKIKFKDLLPKINGLSHAEISLACIDAIKETVLNEKQQMTNDLILKAINDRNAAYHK